MQSTDGKLDKVRVSTRTRKIPYRPGYTWNKGGRLKELRIRHLARKFSKIWMQNTFGRVLPYAAKFHYNNVILRRAFEAWRDEWWTSRREWSLSVRADCHYRYYLYKWTLCQWQKLVSLQKQKKTKMQRAKVFADKRLAHLVWDRWEVFVEMRRMKKRMLESALHQRRRFSIHSAWSLWQIRLHQRRDLRTLEDKVLRQRSLTLQRKAWLQWKEMHVTACLQKKKESKAVLHFTIRLRIKTLQQWKLHVSKCQRKKKMQALAEHACCLHLVGNCWNQWINALDRKRSEENRLNAAADFAVQSIQRRTLMHWKAYVMLCREKAEINQMASQHCCHHLMRAGLRGLCQNVMWNKTHRLNNNIAVQQWQQMMTRKYWKLWQDRLEEAEDQSFQPLTQMAQTAYSISLLRSCFSHWREKLAEKRHMKDLEQRADLWFVDRMFPRCFQSWVKFTVQRRLREQRRQKAEVYNRQRQYSWVFYTWWGQSEKHQGETHSERMAVLHEERGCLQRAWSRWQYRTRQRIKEVEKQEASHHLYQHSLLHKTVLQWKHNSTEIRERRDREQQACHQGDLCQMRWAVEKWKKFVQSQKVKKNRLKEIQHYHEVKLVRRIFVAWKKHHFHLSKVYQDVEELHQHHSQHFLREVLTMWKENAELLAEAQVAEQQAQNHEYFLQLKVLHAWREAAARAVSKRYQQQEALSRAEKALNQVRLLRFFRRWRKRTRQARDERICMEKARQHHNSKILFKTLKAWKVHHYQQRKYKLQHRRREAKQTEQALWHWSLTLQAKVLFGWKLWVTEQRRKQEQTAKVALVYKDQLLREGITCILTYAAHMNDLTASITQHNNEQRSKHIQRVVKRCAMQWKQRVLGKPPREQQVRAQAPKKSVTFCSTVPVSLSDSVEQEADDGVHHRLVHTRKPRCQPRHCKELFESPLKETTRKGIQKPSGVSINESAPGSFFESGVPAHKDRVVSSSLRHASVNSTHQRPSLSATSHPEAHMSSLACSQETQTRDLLLPPSAFMITRTPDTFGKPSSPGKAPLVCFPHHNDPSTYPEIHNKASSQTNASCVEDSETDTASVLTKELLTIQQDMKNFQQDRKQLRTWRKLKAVLETWLRTSGEDEEMERNAICQELKELEEHIDSLSTKLDKRRPTMLLHAERIKHLQFVLHATGVYSLCGKQAETESFVFST
ncbi:protein SFI1 homolog isoform 2-T2 [Pholidichthys leucotaenia]